MQNVELLSVEELCGELEYTTIHYFCHLMHTVEIIGYNHPDEKVRSVASEYYFGLVTALHLNPETKEQLDKRLEDRV